ncbi:hypothetical protein [Halomonas alimentaria]|uniref:Uncharacterized protein n=1 Tax=Halomonas alimentaria TaxID=147248 RepID=A0A7X4W4C4_9GAMM|nr:hypothetical protein [Halomonas alimentaria]NAW33226.1 hypothetical protein [Halomonas alimentaria]
MARTPYSGWGSEGLQVFTPSRIEEIAAGGSLDTTGVVAIRIPADTEYQLNGGGPVAIMPAGATGIAPEVTSITFVTAVTVEVM